MEPATLALATPTMEMSSSTPLRILVIDDQKVIRTLLARTLSKSAIPCEVELAENGVDGCMAIARFRPHLVILDVVMPELSGEAICWAIKTSVIHASTKVLLITGKPDDPQLEAALAAGADAWLAKPFSPDELLDKVAELLGLDAPLPAAH
jgi:CheY-like chemotaxis protein